MTNTAQVIGGKTFSGEDQKLFARISGDRNPMHMDPVAARRLITGRQVVHGIHVLLQALEFWRPDMTAPLVSIACTFNNPLSVGDPAVYRQSFSTGNTWTIEVMTGGLLCAQITLAQKRATAEGLPSIADDTAATPAQSQLHILQHTEQPLDQTPEFHHAKLYALTPVASDVSKHFPHSNHFLGYEGLTSMLALSYFVGMVCPGLNSVFSSLSVDAIGSSSRDNQLLFSIAKYDPRFRLFNIHFRGVIEGSIKAFFRPPPQSQTSLQSLAQHVDAEEFKGSRALVIGGSRGLGEATAKILAAGGANVIISYATGFDDAMATCDEINTAARSHCRVLRLDVTVDAFESVDLDWDTLDTIYFFATPRIFRKKAEVFDVELFQEFCNFYAAKFYAMCVFLENTLTKGKVKVYFPSTVFIDERPKGMAEYAMAKASAEILVQEINRSFRKLAVTSTRLPRLSTDQTTSIASVSSASNTETLLPLVRSLQT